MQPSSDHGLPVDHNDHLRPTVGSAVDHSNPPTPEQASEPLLATSEMHKQLADLKEACAIANTDANRWNRIAVDRLAEIERLSNQSSPVDHYKLLECTAESQVDGSEPPAEDEPAVEVAAITVDSPPMATSELLVDEPEADEPEAEPAGVEVRANTIKSIPKPMTGSGLGKRLRLKNKPVNQSTVSRQKDDGNESFFKWSKNLDPDKIGWRYDPSIKSNYKFFPVIDAPSS